MKGGRSLSGSDISAFGGTDKTTKVTVPADIRTRELTNINHRLYCLSQPVR
jgi:hypothetical protein